MALFQSVQVIANKAIPATRGGVDVAAITGEFVVPAGLALNDIIEFVGLPAGHIPVDLVVSAPDMDTGTTITLDAGILTGRFGDPVLGSRTIGSEFFAASTVGQAGGLARAAKSLSGVLPKTSEQGVGLKVAAAATGLTTGGTIRVTLFVVAAPAETAFA
jgi:hypothetical protein